MPTYVTTGTYGQSAGGNPATTVACGVPSGVALDDVVVLHVYVDGTTATATPPAGFTEAPDSGPAASNHMLRVYWKRATGAESGTYTVTFSVSTFAEAVAVRYSGCVSTGSPFDGTNSNTIGAGFSATSPPVSVTTTGTGRLLVHSATNWSGGTWTPSSGFTTRASGGFNLLHVASKDQPGAGSSGTVQATCSASDRTTAWLGALAGPAAGGTTYTATAAGVSTSAGSAAVTLRLAAAASGASTSGGSAAAGRLMAAAASGASTSGGSAAVTVTLAAAAAGASASAGTAAGTVVPPGPVTWQAAASGASVSGGSGAARMTITTAAIGSSATSGSATAGALLAALASAAATSVGTALAVILGEAVKATSTATVTGAASTAVLSARRTSHPEVTRG